jgi:hypothetical protein
MSRRVQYLIWLGYIFAWSLFGAGMQWKYHWFESVVITFEAPFLRAFLKS